MAPREYRGVRLPIDAFFRSLAQDRGERAVSIVLSGTGSDGTLGTKAIKGEGGMTMAQSPDSAAYDGMPRNAIDTGGVDYVLAPADMSARAGRVHAARLPPHRGPRHHPCAEYLGGPGRGADHRPRPAPPRLLGLQTEHREPAHRAPPRRQPDRQPGGVRAPPAPRPPRSRAPLQGTAHRGDQLLSRPLRVGGARRRGRARHCWRRCARTLPCASGCPAAPPAKRPSRSPSSCRSAPANCGGK